MLTDAEKLGLYRQALSQIVHEAGGHLRPGPPDDEFTQSAGTLMNRPTEDGGIEFRLVLDGRTT